MTSALNEATTCVSTKTCLTGTGVGRLSTLPLRPRAPQRRQRATQLMTRHRARTVRPRSPQPVEAPDEPSSAEPHTPLETAAPGSKSSIESSRVPADSNTPHVDRAQGSEKDALLGWLRWLVAEDATKQQELVLAHKRSRHRRHRPPQRHHHRVLETAQA